MSLPRFELRRSEGYRVVHASGALVSLNPNEGTIIFFVDRLSPKVNPDGSMSVEAIERELLVEVKLSPVGFKSLAMALLGNIQEFEKRAGEIRVQPTIERRERDLSI